jgi:hypothetical protein
MAKWRYSGDTGKYANFTKKQLLEILKDEPIPNRMRLTRIRLITLVEKLRYPHNISS